MAAASVLVLLVAFASAVLAQDTISLLGYNDQHGHIEPSDYNYLLCSKGTKKNISDCPGGFARMTTFRKQWFAAHPKDAILVQAGDEFVGTAWTTYYKGLEAYYYDTLLGVQVGTLGNHDFDLGTPTLAKNFVSKIKYPLTVCNMKIEKSSPLYGLKQLTTGPVIKTLASGVKVGFVGWITTETLVDDNVGPGVTISDYPHGVQTCINTLHKKGITYIIGLGHAGIDEDERVIKETKGLTFVIGGHSHTFMWPPTNYIYGAKLPVPCMDSPNKYCDQDSIMASPYPQLVGDSAGRTVPYFQAKWGTHYMDTVQVAMNKTTGTVLLNTLSAVPVLMGGENSDNFVPQDAYVNKQVEYWSRPINAQYQRTVGYTAVPLPRPTAFSDTHQDLNETLLGDIGTDAMVYYFRHLAGYSEFVKQYGPVDVAITNPGGLRVNLPVGNITAADCLAVFPFGDYNIVIETIGTLLSDTLLYGMANLGPQTPEGDDPEFYPQVYAGAKIDVTIQQELNKTSGVTSTVKVVLNKPVQVAYNGVYEDIIPTKKYYVVATNYLVDQQDSFFLKGAPVVYNFGLTQDVTMADYLTANFGTPATAFKKPLDGRLKVKYVTVKTVA